VCPYWYVTLGNYTGHQGGRDEGQRGDDPYLCQLELDLLELIKCDGTEELERLICKDGESCSRTLFKSETAKFFEVFDIPAVRGQALGREQPPPGWSPPVPPQESSSTEDTPEVLTCPVCEDQQDSFRGLFAPGAIRRSEVGKSPANMRKQLLHGGSAK
jgi:hypothetical protein